MAKSLKDKLLKIIFGRRTLSGQVYDAEDLKAEYLQMEPTKHIKDVTVEVETSDVGERVQGEITITVKDGDNKVCCIYLGPQEAEALAALLLDPLKG